MSAPVKIEKEEGRRVLWLTVTDDAELALAATVVKRSDGTWLVGDAFIDQTPAGALSALGMDAYRVPAMVEVILAKALGLKVIDPREELAQLQKENGELRRLLFLAKDEIKELKGAAL